MMISTRISCPNDRPENPPRRRVLIGAAALAGAALTGAPALAMSDAQAKALVDKVVADINRIIASGKPEKQMYRDFEQIFARYAYVDGIARTVLGPPARQASKAQMRAFAKAFQGYMGRKYGKRFREFIGGKVIVKGARKIKSFYEVTTTVVLRGEDPFTVTFMVSDKSGKPLFFDMLIEGISLLKSEKSEIGAMLDKRRGNLDALIADLKKAG